MQGLTQRELDNYVREGCQVPHCTHKHEQAEIWLSPRCHRTEGVFVVYREGVVILECAVCRTHICTVAVAEGEKNDLYR
jgi:hypothetical protein